MWGSIFDQYKLNAAFENHNHFIKLTKPLNNNEPVTEEGVLYLGDGAIGADLRGLLILIIFIQMLITPM